MTEYKQTTLLHEISDSIEVLSDKILTSTKTILLTAKNEEDLKIRFEGILSPILESIGIGTTPQYEHRQGNKSIYRGPSDAMHGQVIIEYESPDKFSSDYWIDHAHDQLINYMRGEASQNGVISNDILKRLVGVGFDGYRIFFVQYRGSNGLSEETDRSLFKRTAVYFFDKETARTFLFYLRALRRKPINAQNLTEKFGPNGDIARSMVSGFVDALENWKKKKVCIFYKEWKRLFGIVYGEHLSSTAHENVEELCTLYGLTTEIEFQELLFCVHTYFALLMKLIASELVTLKESRLASSFSQNLVHTSSKTELISILTQIEDGDVFKSKGITNFLEGDFFRWYLDAISPRLEDAIREMARTISEFEPATSTIDPEPTRDLLKKLYQYLVQHGVRQKLGEYYTPDWLAELILDEVSYVGENTRKRVLDPSCGSGTFVVLAIQRAREYGLTANENRRVTTQRILRNIWGFDLNPLAVIASRTNYLFALGDSINDLEEVEIPIYLADSVLWPQRTMGQIRVDIEEGDHVKIQTSVELFHVPCSWIRDGGLLIKKVSPELERMVKSRYQVSEVIERLRHYNLIDSSQEIVAERFYSELLSLELQDKDGIWTRFIKNAITPMMAGRFDLVVGNPPWIRWGYLSKEYREATLQMWKDYGLFSLRGQQARLGGGEKDFSMLFLYACVDYYLKDHATLGFLITQEVFKSKGAGEGFRRFTLRERDSLKILKPSDLILDTPLEKAVEPFKVIKAHDLVSVKPFEKAANKTAAIILIKGESTEYPIPYTLWTRKKGIGKIATDISLDEAKKSLIQQSLIAKPIGTNTSSWQTIPSDSEIDFDIFKGKNWYVAKRGASTEPYGIYWLKVDTILSDGNLLIQNLPELGDREISKVNSEKIESNYVFPAIRGSDISRWNVQYEIYVLMVQDPKTRKPIDEKFLKTRYPRTYGYLSRFKHELLSRGSNTVRELAEKTAFYAMFGIGKYTVEKYKVIWKRMAGDIVAVVVSQNKTPFGYRTPIPTDTTAFFPVEDEDEAHYLCAIINSRNIRDYIKTYSSSGRGFGAPTVMEPIGILKYDGSNIHHKQLSNLSKECHDLASQNKNDQILLKEKELNDLVLRLFKFQKAIE